MLDKYHMITLYVFTRGSEQQQQNTLRAILIGLIKN